VSRLLAAGAILAGKTQMDELAYSVVGENAHYGTPINPAAPDRVPGGSSATVASPLPATLLVAGDAFALASPAVARALEPAIAALRQQVPAVESMRLVAAGADLGLDQSWFRVWSVQVREVWTIHGDWIMRVRPESRVLTRDHLTVGAASTPAEEEAARGVWQELAATVRRAIPPGPSSRFRPSPMLPRRAAPIAPRGRHSPVPPSVSCASGGSRAAADHVPRDPRRGLPDRSLAHRLSGGR
jgi:hypothetical protein